MHNARVLNVRQEELIVVADGFFSISQISKIRNQHFRNWWNFGVTSVISTQSTTASSISLSNTGGHQNTTTGHNLDQQTFMRRRKRSFSVLTTYHYSRFKGMHATFLYGIEIDTPQGMLTALPDSFWLIIMVCQLLRLLGLPESTVVTAVCLQISWERF